MMNLQLIDSIVQLVNALPEAERQVVARRINALSIRNEVADLHDRMSDFETQYGMNSESFYQEFQAGNLGDSADFFEWNAYYEMFLAAQVKVA
jgi:hypothetical protein